MQCAAYPHIPMPIQCKSGNFPRQDYETQNILGNMPKRKVNHKRSPYNWESGIGTAYPGALTTKCMHILPKLLHVIPWTNYMNDMADMNRITWLYNARTTYLLKQTLQRDSSWCCLFRSFLVLFSQRVFGPLSKNSGLIPRTVYDRWDLAPWPWAIGKFPW